MNDREELRHYLKIIFCLREAETEISTLSDVKWVTL